MQPWAELQIRICRGLYSVFDSGTNIRATTNYCLPGLVGFAEKIFMQLAAADQIVNSLCRDIAFKVQ